MIPPKVTIGFPRAAVFLGVAVLVCGPTLRAEKPRSVSKVEVQTFQTDKSYDLAGLIDLALINNPATRAAWQSAQAAQGVVGEARAPYYPQLSAEYRGGVDQGYAPNATGPNVFTRVQSVPALVLEYILLDFGRRDADLQRTLHALDAAQLGFNRQLQRTVYQLQRAYFQHLAALAQEEAAVANLELSRTVLSMVEDQLKSGLATQPELLMARQVHAQAEFDREDAVRRVQTSLGVVRTAAGVPANAPLRLRKFDPPESYGRLQTKLDALIDSAVESRPDLAARVAELRAGEQATRRARADFLPTVGLEAGYGFDSVRYHAQDERVKGTYDFYGHNYGAFLVVDWDLFDGFARVNKVKQRVAEEEQARAEVEAKRLETILDVWTAYYDVLSARRRVDFAQAQLASSRETSAAIKASFDEGLATVTEVVSAQSGLATARYARASADADYLTAAAALSYALGQNPASAVRR